MVWGEAEIRLKENKFKKKNPNQYYRIFQKIFVRGTRKKSGKLAVKKRMEI